MYAKILGKFKPDQDVRPTAATGFPVERQVIEHNVLIKGHSPDAFCIYNNILWVTWFLSSLTV